MLWGTIGPVVGAVHDATGLSVLALSGYRSLLGFAVVLAVVLLRGVVRATWRSLASHGRAVLLAGALTAAFQTLFFVAVSLAGVGVVTVVALGSAPVALTLVAALGRRRLPGGWDLVPLAAALVGLGLVSLSGEQVVGPQPAWGLLAALASGLAYAGATHVGGGLAAHLGPLALTVGTTGVLAVVAPFVLVAAGLLGEPLTAPGAAPWLAVVHLGVVTLVLAYALLYAGLRTVTGAAVAVVTLLEPVVAVGIAVTLLDEPLTAPGAAGTTLVLLAVVALALDRRAPDVLPGGPASVDHGTSGR